MWFSDVRSLFAVEPRVADHFVAGRISHVDEYARQQKRRFGRRIVELLAALGAADPEILGEQLAVLADGAASRSMVLNDARCGRYARAAAEALLDEAIRR